MVDLRNFEYFAGSGTPISGATVKVYDAIKSGALGAAKSFTDHNGAVGTQTTSNPDGMWEAKGLTGGSGLYDVKIEYTGQVKWYKGYSRHNVEHLQDDTTTQPGNNLLPNPSLDLWTVVGLTGVNLPVGEPAAPNIADGWLGFVGTGDSAIAAADSTVHESNSRYGYRVVYTRSAGQCYTRRYLPSPLLEQVRGKTLSAVASVFQLTTSSLMTVSISDNTGTSTGSLTNVTGAWTTVNATRTISATATFVAVTVNTNRSDTGARTFYIDNVMLVESAVVPVFTPNLHDVAANISYTLTDDTVVPVTDGQNLQTLISNLANRIKAISGAAGWKSAPAGTIASLVAADVSHAASIASLTAADVTLTNAVNSKVAKSGDTMSGGLTFPNNVGVQLTQNPASGGTIRLVSFIDIVNQLWYGTTALPLVLTGSSLQWWTGASLQTIWRADNDGPASGMNSDLLDNQEGSFYQDRANHTGVQAPGTISPQGPGSTLNADALDNQDGSFYQARGNHTGTQAPGTISPQGAGSGLNADLLQGNGPGNFATSGHGHAAGDAVTLNGLASTAFSRIMSSTYVGNAASRNISTGFTPRFVIVQRTSGGVNTMGFIAGHDIMLFDGAGTGSNTGHSLNASSFTVTAGSPFNVSGQSYLWVAFG